MLSLIRKAFSNVTRVNALSIRQAAALDDYAPPEEMIRVGAFDVDAHWWEIPDKVIIENDCALSFCDPLSWRYHLPAFMSFALRRYLDSNSMAVDRAIYTLKPTKGLNEWTERYEGFDSHQKHAAARFLRFMKERSEGMADETVAKRALDEYWAPFLVDPA